MFSANLRTVFKGFIQYLNLNLVGYEPRLKFCGEIIALANLRV